MHADYTGYGVDQLLQCVERIKTNPEDRRIIMCAWNPLDIPKMALPPCHVLCQFYVANNELSCHMYQRSADFGLGVPFNIASYALLTVMMAHVTNLNPGEFVHSIGDAHVYLNHVEALKEQLRREPRPFPKLYIETNKSDITTFEFSDFRVVDYQPDASIKMKMAV
jgi:thymidylate synthase